jgi:hypothetical protein
MMADLGMSTVNAAVKFAIENHSTADAGTDRHIDQAGTILACTPSRFGEGGRIAVIFERDADVEYMREIFDRIFSAPAGEEIYVAELSPDGVDRPRRSDADAGEFCARLARRFAEHAGDELQAVVVTIRVSGSLRTRKNFAAVVDDTDCDFRSADVDSTDHENFSDLTLLSSSEAKDDNRKSSALKCKSSTRI